MFYGTSVFFFYYQYPLIILGNIIYGQINIIRYHANDCHLYMSDMAVEVLKLFQYKNCVDKYSIPQINYAGKKLKEYKKFPTAKYLTHILH